MLNELKLQESINKTVKEELGKNPNFGWEFIGAGDNLGLATKAINDIINHAYKAGFKRVKISFEE